MRSPQIATPTRPARPYQRLAVRTMVVAALLVGAHLASGHGSATLRETPATVAEVPAGRVHPVTRSARTCAQCHDQTLGISHPVDVRPSMAIPAGFPLENGRLVCTTCHQSEPSGKPMDGSMLRNPGAAMLCAQCHASTPRSGPEGHAGTLVKAHPGALGGTVARGATVQSLDDESRQCMSCHDGNVAPDAGRHLAGGILESEMLRDHPVGVAYRSAGVRRSDARLKPMERLDPRVRLFGGTVGCGSCHSVYSKQPSLLVTSNLGRGL